MTTIDFVIHREVVVDGDKDYEEIELVINGVATPYTPPRLSGHPDSWCPGEGGEAYIEEILLDGEPWKGELTVSETELAEQYLLDQAADDAEEAKAEAQIEAYEARRYDSYDRYSRW